MEFYDNYIVFVLGADNFKISKQLRTIAELQGNMDEVYDKCVYIAKRFAEYDSALNLCTTPPYYILCEFLEEYDKELTEYVMNGEEFEVKEDFN